MFSQKNFGIKIESTSGRGASIRYDSNYTEQWEYHRTRGIFKKIENIEAVVDITWVFFALRSSDETGSRWLSETIDGVNQLIALGEFRHLDRALEAVKTETASRQILLGLARSTYPVRSKLNYWKHFLFDVHKTFRVRGLDAGRLLKGLIDQ